MPGLMQNDAEFSLPLADHTYALDSFPTDEVPTVLAFEEVESERAQTHQSLFSIVEEHAYAHRIQKLPDDEWTNFPDVAGPDSVDAGIQTDPVVEQMIPDPEPDPIPVSVPQPTAATSELSSTVNFVRFASVTVSASMLGPLRSTAARLRIAITTSGPRVRCRRLTDLVRLLCAVERPPPRASSLTGSSTAAEGPRGSVRQVSGRIASHFHIQDLLGITEEEEAKKAAQRDRRPPTDPTEVFVCTECSQQFSTKGSLTRHKRSHRNPEARFQCTQCPASYRRADTLREHRCVKHRETASSAGKFSFQCNSCFKLFKRKSVLQDHINRHIGVQAYKCPLCSQKFTGRALLRYHMRSRHDEEVSQPPNTTGNDTNVKREEDPSLKIKEEVLCNEIESSF